MPRSHPKRTLAERIEAGIRERLEEAIDATCLDAMASARRAGDLPAPSPDSTADREEYRARVREFLGRLALLGQTPEPEIERLGDSLEEAARRAGDDEEQRLMAVQVVLARALPDYWQRFEEIRIRYAVEGMTVSGREGGSLLRRLLRRHAVWRDRRHALWRDSRRALRRDR